jgi:hypothetical protein
VVVMVMVVVVMVVLRRIRWDSRSGKNGDTQKGKHPNAKLHGISPVTVTGLCTGDRLLLTTYNPVSRRTFQQGKIYSRSARSRESTSLLHIHQKIVTLNAQREDAHFFSLGKVRKPCVYIECPGMPRADDGIALNPSRTKRPLPVRTQIFKCAQLAIHARQADVELPGTLLVDRALRRRLSNSTQPNPLRHRVDKPPRLS